MGMEIYYWTVSRYHVLTWIYCIYSTSVMQMCMLSPDVALFSFTKNIGILSPNQLRGSDILIGTN
jgi:hypothetical protein